MKSLAIARKTLLEYLREPLLLGLVFAFPVILLFFYYVAFGETEEGMAKHLKLMALNRDAGTRLGAETVNLGAQIVQGLAEAQFEGSPIFDVRVVASRAEAEISLREQKAALLLVIPPDFSAAILNAASGAESRSPATLTLVGYPSSDNFVFSRNIVESLIAEFVDLAAGEPGQEIAIAYEFVPGTGTMTDFEFGVPGLIVFGITFLTVSTAMTMVREEVNGTLRRLRVTALRARDLILGVTAAQLVIGVILVPFTFGAALTLGFHSRGSIWLAILVGVLLSLSAVGLGLLTACFARSDGEAANLAAIIGVMLVIVSGAMYPMPKAPLFTLFGQTIEVYDLLPAAHAGRALQRILIFGDGLREIAYPLTGLILLAAIILGAGIVLYQRIKLK